MIVMVITNIIAMMKKNMTKAMVSIVIMINLNIRCWAS